MAFELIVNGTRHSVDADPQTPLLWVIRDHVGLTGTKFSCGIGQCGACTLHVDGRPVRSCSVPAADGGRQADHDDRRPLARRQPSHPDRLEGTRHAAVRLLPVRDDHERARAAARPPKPTDADIDAQVTNACRCSTYHRIRQAIHLAADLMKDERRCMSSRV